MNYNKLFVLLFIVFLVGCENELFIDTSKDTYNDDISDICYVGGFFYTTNYDLSGNSGSQIDLIRFTANGENINDAFDLEMNGQGYLAMTTDGFEIFMQSQSNGAIIKTSLIGERAYMRWDSLETNQWMASGICYNGNKDSLVLLYRNMAKKREYRARTVSKIYPYMSGTDQLFTIDFIDTSYYGVWALTFKNDAYYLLGADTLINDKLIITDGDFNLITVEDISDSTVVGLCFKENDLYLSYRERRIEFWGSY